MKNKFSICAFNVENLFLPPYSEEDSYILYKYEKSKDKVERLAKAIKDIDSDIIFLCEVGGEDSLKNLVEVYLDNNYLYSLMPGNSERGIELAYLIKKGSEYTFKHLTHKRRPLNFNYPHEEKENHYQMSMGKKRVYPSHLPSRDIAELRVFKEGSEKPFLILLGVHLKSQLDKEGIDFGGRLRRAAEFKQLVETYNVLNKRYHQKVPILLLGDFNGKACREETDPEFQKIYESTDLEDVLEVINEPKEARVSIHIFDKQGKDQGHQLDYIFVPKMLHKKIDAKHSGLYNYKNEEGAPYPRPTSLYERYQLPSDHFPIVCTIKNFPN
ncbi:hypothetical protein [Halobacteriovorax sp.]|uniref:endonuclease/exonuclease/phosphatase family protein n=1 Tax=Halobacteriovorax sp. TaxID=2020862 RepID=UPI0035624BA2